MTNNKNINYCIYARAQLHNPKSLLKQVKELTIKAKKEQLNVVEIYGELGSGADTKRPLLNSMLKNITKNKIDGILCTGIHTITRNFKLMEKINYLFRDKKLSVITTSDSNFYNNNLN